MYTSNSLRRGKKAIDPGGIAVKKGEISRCMQRGSAGDRKVRSPAPGGREPTVPRILYGGSRVLAWMLALWHEIASEIVAEASPRFRSHTVRVCTCNDR